MKTEHLELIRRLYDAMNRRDADALRRFGAENPEFAWASSSDELDPGTRIDSKQALAYSRELFEVFDRLQTEVEEEIPLGPTHAVFLVRHRGRGAASGAEVDRREAHLWTASRDRILSLREYPTLEEARVVAAAE
jgi:ketosteroid isomerase-like protein